MVLGPVRGQALAEIIYGKVNPSGKLPVTIGKNESDYPSYASYSNVDDYLPAGLFGYPATKAKTVLNYSEGLFTGYRGFDKTNTKPLYAFGFGLSYTSYAYSDLKLSSNTLKGAETVDATFTLTNRGDMDGFEVAQLYVSPAKTAVDRPEKELTYYVQNTDTWNVDASKFTIRVGGSSDELPLKEVLTATTAQKLGTDTSNPLPAPVRQAVQVSEDQKY